MNAKFNYATHNPETRDKISAHLQEKGLTFEMNEIRGEITGNPTYEFTISLPFGTPEEVTQARQISEGIKSIIAE